METLRLSLITPPAVEPVTLADAKQHIRAIGTDDDEYIANLIAAARDKVETLTQRALITQTWLAVWDFFPTGRVIRLPKSPVSTITHVKYYPDGASTLATLSSSLYQTEILSNPARVILLENCSFPSTWDEGDAVQIQYVCGYGSSPAYVPAELKQAILILVAHWYSARQPVQVGATVTDMPKSVEYLAMPYRVWGVAC